MGTGSFLGVKRPRRGLSHSPHLAPRLKKKKSDTSSPLLGLCGLFFERTLSKPHPEVIKGLRMADRKRY
jgi:hypothetical protein